MVSFEELNSTQKDVCTSLDENLLVIAGPGSGKTEMLVHRFNKLVEDGVHPEDIVLTTFGKEASVEIEERVNADEDEYDLNIGTIHSTCLDILKTEYHNTDYNSTPYTISGYKREGFIADVVKPYIGEEYNKVTNQLVEDVSKVALKNIDRVRKNDMDPENAEGRMDFIDNETLRRINNTSRVKNVVETHLSDIFKDYRKKLINENRVDYGEMLVQTKKLFENDDDIRAQYDMMYEHIIVDEAQDLNKIQYDFLELLSQDNDNLTLVGDDSQCIYTWRGSDPSLLQDFKEEYDARRVLVEINYRSSKPIVDVVNKINNELEGIEHKIMRSNDGLVEKSEGFPKVKSASAEEVAQLVRENIVDEGYSPNDIAILTRTGNSLYSYQKELEAMGIPTQNLSKNDFKDIRNVKSAYGYVRTAMKKDPKGIKAYLKGQQRCWTPGKVEEASDNQNTPMWKYIQSMTNMKNHTTKNKARKVKDDIKFINKLSDDDYPFETLMETKFRKGRTSNIEALQSAYHRLGKEQFFEFMETDREEYGVTVSTVHGAKGKEWKVVIVADVNDGRFPKEDTEEEKRVFYVACSRPDERLYITYDPEKEPSKFIRMLAS